MKEFVDLLRSHHIILKEIELLDNKKLGIKKRAKIYFGITIDDYYIFLLDLKQKSPILQKNIIDIEEMFEKTKIFREHNFKKKILIIVSRICSKAEFRLKNSRWEIINASM